MRELRIGRLSAGFITQGHPWVRSDRFTGDCYCLDHGEAVTLVDEHGRGLASALIDRQHPQICARVYHRQPGKRFAPLAAAQRAFAKRETLHHDRQTNCYRLLHAEGDFLPGLRAERLNDYLVVQQRAALASDWADEVAAFLADALSIPYDQVVMRHHLQDQRRQVSKARLLSGKPLDPEVRVIGHELAAPAVLLPAHSLACGIYVDQRATREWLRRDCQNARVLNLFAYSGLFATCLVQAGARQAVNVDCSAPALALSAENARLAGVAEACEHVHADCLEFCNSDRRRFDLIICDPPTAAQGGGGWVARRDYPTLLTAAWQRLASGGLLVACVNTLSKPYPLAKVMRSLDLPLLKEHELPDLAADIPQLRGFPEGRPFRIVAARKP